MFLITRRHKQNSAGFTLAETLVSTFIAFFVVAAVWSVYMMAYVWWHEISPEIEAERAARAAVSSIVYGAVDSTAGTDTVGINTYTRRNGIAWARFDPNVTLPATPTISVDQKTINFRLEADSSNARQFYLATDAASGKKGVYYKNNLNQTQLINSTLGLTNLQFSFFTEAGVTNYKIVKVLATVERDILGTRNIPKHIKVEYADYAYLKNEL